jgi:Dolichyl-phosphate-mannose-protein mannosyltransferase
VDATWGRSGEDAATSAVAPERAGAASSWLVAAGAVVGGLTALRLLFLVRSGLNLDFEEAQYWLWAQAPAWGYWSKPPMVAWLIAATTAICGDAEPCIRLASPLLHGATALVLGALGATLSGPGLGFWSAVTYATLPGVALSAVLITTDVPLLLCWALALLAFARLLRTGHWPWAALCGLALGAGMLSKYSMLVVVPCAVIYLVLSGRRLPLRHAALAIGLAALVVAPNVGWNLSHDLGTVRHALSRLRPGVSSLRPDEPLLFVLAQLVVFGPLLYGWLLARELRFWRPPGDDSRLLLGAFTVPPLALAIVVSVVARANANWAAPAYVGGTVLVAWCLLRSRRSRLLQASLAVNAGLGLLLYGVLANVPAIALPHGTVVPVAARLGSWDQLGREIASRAAALGDARVLVDLRELLAVAGYYGRVPEDRLVEWNPDGVPHSQFQLRTRIAAGDPGPFLFVSYRPKPAGVIRRFESAELVETVSVDLAPGLDRTHWLFALRGFRGYPGGRPETRPGPRTSWLDLIPRSRQRP